MMTLTYIVAAVVLLGLCITIHELGHLLGGKMVGIKAKIFSLGYGKGFIKKKIGDTTYQITLIPLGGYCMFYGESPEEKREGRAYEFLSASPMRRFVTVLMGPLFNLFFGILLFFIMNMAGYEKETNKILIPRQITSGSYISAAYSAGLRTGDKIIKINDNPVRTFGDIQESVLFSEGEALEVTVERNNSKMDFMVSPDAGSGGKYSIGVMPYGKNIQVAGVLENDVARKAGLEEMDEIISVDGRRFIDPLDFTDYIKVNAGNELKMKISRDGKILTIGITPRVDELVKVEPSGKNKETLLINENVFKAITEERVVWVGNVSVKTFDGLLSAVKNNKSAAFVLEEKGKKALSGQAILQTRGFIGIMPTITPEMVKVQYGFTGSMVRALVEPYEFIVMNLKGMAMLFSGKIDVRENLSGPIRIAKIAGDVAYYKGLSAFIILMAQISIILMVMNLLPIPVVDGSHLVFFIIEAIRGKPLSDTVMEKIQTFGVVLLIMLFVFIIINDITMLPFFQKLF